MSKNKKNTVPRQSIISFCSAIALSLLGVFLPMVINIHWIAWICIGVAVWLLCFAAIEIEPIANKLGKAKMWVLVSISIIIFAGFSFEAGYDAHIYEMTITQKLTEWSWETGASVATIDPSVPDLRGRSVAFALKTLNSDNIYVDVVETKGEPNTLYFESPVDDSASLNVINSLDSEKHLI